MPTTATAPKRRTAAKSTNARPREPALTVEQLLAMDQAGLDDLFCASTPGKIPKGAGEGTVVAAPGTPMATLLATVLGLAWQGKVFYPAGHDLLNRVLPFGVRAIRAKVYREESWFDGREAIILDYSKSSLVARSIRDEMREVSPGVYLGIVYVRRLKTINFVLSFA